MATVYKEIPYNYSDVESFFLTSEEDVIRKIFSSDKCFFYDTCSFRTHANLRADAAEFILQHIEDSGGVIIITGTVLMELASISGVLNEEYVSYLRHINEFGIPIVLLYEESLFDVLSVCFTSNSKVNEYLTWAVRMVRNPVSTITLTLKEDRTLQREVVEVIGSDNGTLYSRFFKAVRSNKESDDDLGEEMIAICLHLLTHLVGEPDGKYCVITDDKGAAGKINTMLEGTHRGYQGSKVYILSTPKLVQIMNRNGLLEDRDTIRAILRSCSPGNIKVHGARMSDLRSTEISLTCEELAELILEPNGINIIF